MPHLQAEVRVFNLKIATGLALFSSVERWGTFNELKGRES